MLVLPLEKGHPFHEVLEASLHLSNVALVHCSTRGLIVQAVDTECTGIVELLWPAENFPGYSCDEDISMGIPINVLVEAIRFGGDKDVITLKVGKEHFGTVTLSIVSPDTGPVEYDVRLAGDELARLQLPGWKDLGSNYQGSVEMPSMEFRRICKYLTNLGEDDVVVISVTNKVLKFFAFGKRGDVYMEYKQSEDPNTIKIDMQEPVELYLDRKYLNTFAKFFNLSGQVKLSLSKTHPLIIQYEIGQMGHIRCFMAQNMETESQGGEEEKEVRSKKKKRKRPKKLMQTRGRN